MAKMTKQQQKTLMLVLVFVIGGGYVYWNYMLMPTLRSIKEREQRYTDLVGQIAQAERQARRLPALRSELERLQVDLSSLEKQLPTDKDIPNILRTLTREALQQGLQFSRLSPKPLVKQQYFEIIPFDLQFMGTLHGLARFLSSLGQQDRIYQAQNMGLAPAGSMSDTGFENLNITITIQTYAYVG